MMENNGDLKLQGGCLNVFGVLDIGVLVLAVITGNVLLGVFAVVGIVTWTPRFFVSLPLKDEEVSDAVTSRLSQGMITTQSQTVIDTDTWQYKVVSVLLIVSWLASLLAVGFGLVVLGQLVLG